MLELRFSTHAGRVVVSCDPALSRSLQPLRGRFSSSTSISNTAFELDIDDLLVNLQELAAWPSEDADIRWQPELLSVVEGNAADAALMASSLLGTATGVMASTAMLGSRWCGDLNSLQLRDLERLLQLRHGANFSVPGAGKTRVTLALYEASRLSDQVNALFVVCPKSAFESWTNEAEICFGYPRPSVSVMDGSAPPPTEIVLVNYERLPDARGAIINWLRLRSAMIVLDEAHRMKLGPVGAWGSVCLALGPYAKKRVILTGTPAPNGAKDLENLFGFVWPGQGRATVSDALSENDLRETSTRLRPLYVRTRKSELPIPPLDPPVVRRVELPRLHRELYNALLGQASVTWRAGEQDLEALGKIFLYLLMAATTPALLATGSSRYEPLPYRLPPLAPPPGSDLARLIRDLPLYEMSPKYQEAAAIVSENAALGRKTLVWSTFVRSLKTLELLLARFRPAVVHGGTENRADELARFRNDADCMVLLSNPATLGEGISLHKACNNAIYIDRDFAAGRFLQSLDRIHRLGLAPDVRTRITILIANQTIDELVEQRLAAKLHFLGTVLDDPAVLQLEDLAEEPTISAGMDSNDLQAMIGYLNAHASS